jgi:hypothetical protein
MLISVTTGEKGTAYTLITQKEDSFAAQLVRNLETSGQPVPDKLLDLAMRVRRSTFEIFICMIRCRTSFSMLPMLTLFNRIRNSGNLGR